MGSAAQLTARTFDSVVLESHVPVLVDFWASWCPPCKMVEPVLDRLADRFAARAKVAKLQVDQNPGLRSRYAIQGVPTFCVFDRGEIVARVVGAQSDERLAELLEDALANRDPLGRPADPSSDS